MITVLYVLVLIEPYPVDPFGLWFHALLPANDEFAETWIYGQAADHARMLAEIGRWLFNRGHEWESFEVRGAWLDVVISNS